MDKLKKYQQIIKDILLEYSQDYQGTSEMEMQTIFDQEKDHYQVIILGWEGKKWVHYSLIHLDIKSNKVWIQWNMTEKDIAQDLVNLGIPKEDIVISFHPPQMRKLTGYAVG
jgi:XisI protein